MSKELVAIASLTQHVQRQFRPLAVDARDCAIFLLDPKGNVTDWDDKAEQVTGYETDEVVGENFARFCTGIDRLLGLPEKALVLAARDGLYKSKGWRLGKGGEKLWAKTEIRVFRAHDEILGFAVKMNVLARQKSSFDLARVDHSPRLKFDLSYQPRSFD